MLSQKSFSSKVRNNLWHSRERDFCKEAERATLSLQSVCQFTWVLVLFCVFFSSISPLLASAFRQQHLFSGGGKRALCQEILCKYSDRLCIFHTMQTRFSLCQPKLQNGEPVACLPNLSFGTCRRMVCFSGTEHSTLTSVGIWLGKYSKSIIFSEEHHVLCDFFFFF